MAKYQPTSTNDVVRWRKLRENTTDILMRACAEARWSRSQVMNGECVGEGKRGCCYYVTMLCREALLTGLKANWEDLHHQYQGLSVITDTAPKKARKERMEAEMKQLEKDIELIERHQRLYISQPPSHHC